MSKCHNPYKFIGYRKAMFFLMWTCYKKLIQKCLVYSPGNVRHTLNLEVDSRSKSKYWSPWRLDFLIAVPPTSLAPDSFIHRTVGFWGPSQRDAAGLGIITSWKSFSIWWSSSDKLMITIWISSEKPNPRNLNKPSSFYFTQNQIQNTRSIQY